MNRETFKKFIVTGKSSNSKKPLVSGKSVTDPSFAQTGRQMLTNPLPIEYRMKYPQGAPLDKDNPHKFNEFDKLYPDTFKAIREASQVSTVAETKLKEIDSKLSEKK